MFFSGINVSDMGLLLLYCKLKMNVMQEMSVCAASLWEERQPHKPNRVDLKGCVAYL